MMSRVAIALLLLTPLPGFAQDRILIEEVLPALTGTELGLIALGDAPPPGTVRTVRRSEVLAALRQAGRDARGLAIPAATRVRRQARRIERDELVSLARPAMSEALSPCEIENLELPNRVTIAEGELEVRALAQPPSRSGRVPAVVLLVAGGRESRLVGSAEVRCPPPVITPGDQVRIVVTAGNVRASAPGVATQPGRVGEAIRVTNRLTRSAIVATIVDRGTVRILP